MSRPRTERVYCELTRPSIPQGAWLQRSFTLSLADPDDVKLPTMMMSILLATPKSNEGGSLAAPVAVKPPMMPK